MSRERLEDRVVVEGDGTEGLPRMIADLIRSNTDDDPVKARLLERRRGAVQINVPDAVVTVALRFVPGTVTVTSGPVAGADVTISADAQTLLALSNVPLRLGLPDPLTREGRETVVAMLVGRLRVRGAPWRLGILTTVTRLLNVRGHHGG